MKQKIQIILLLLAMSSRASAEDVASWIARTTKIVNGVTVADGKSAEFTGLRVIEDVEIAPKWNAAGRLDLFSRQRYVTAVPGSLESAADIYSNGELWLSLRFKVSDRLAVEGIGGTAFGMRGVSEDRPASVTPSKLSAAVGVRLSKGESFVLIAAGHSGPTDEGGKVILGFVPALLITSRVKLGENLSLVNDLYAGREAASSDSLVYAWRASIEVGK